MVLFFDLQLAVIATFIFTTSCLNKRKKDWHKPNPTVCVRVPGFDWHKQQLRDYFDVIANLIVQRTHFTVVEQIIQTVSEIYM